MFIGRAPVFHRCEEITFRESSVATTRSMQPFEILVERDNKEVSASDSWLKEDVNAKINRILQNRKMQRWVLNTFKDDEERKEYEKAQIVLASLMKLKRQSEGARPQEKKSGGIRIWLGGERVICSVPYEKGYGGRTIKIESGASELSYERMIESPHREDFFFARQRAFIPVVLFAAFPR
jgi:hypothetical protein